MAESLENVKFQLAEAKRRKERLDSLWGVGLVLIMLYSFYDPPTPDRLLAGVFVAALAIIQVTTSHMIWLQLGIKVSLLESRDKKLAAQTSDTLNIPE